MATAAVSLSAIPADAAPPAGGRSIEVFTGSNLVSLTGYPTSTEVRVEVVRQGFVIGSAVKTTGPAGSDTAGAIEMNHVGGDDCFEGQSSPDIRPGDRLRTTILPAGPTESSVVRGVFVDDFVISDATNEIRVNGHVTLSGPSKVAPGTDVLELRINKGNPDNPWENNDRPNRKDRRVDIGTNVQPDGTWVRVLPTSQDDIDDLQANGFEPFLEWSAAAGAGEEEEVFPPELTVWDEAGGEAIDCPPLQTGPTMPQLARAQDSGNKGDHITNQSANLTFSGLAGPDTTGEDVQPGAGAEVELFIDGESAAQETTGDNAVYRFTGITLAPRRRAHSLKVVASDPGGAPFESAVRKVRVDTKVPRVVLRRLRPTPLHLEGRERLQAVYRIGESARLDAKIQRRTPSRWRTAKAYRDRNVKSAGRVQYFWNGKTAIRRDARPGRYRILLTVNDRAGNQTVHKKSRFRVRR